MMPHDIYDSMSRIKDIPKQVQEEVEAQSGMPCLLLLLFLAIGILIAMSGSLVGWF